MFSPVILATFGISSAIVNTIGLIPYIRDISLKKTKPQRATWWIWLALNIVALAAQWAAGAVWSLGLTIGQLLAIGLIAVLSIRYGYGKFERRDYVSLIIAGIGIGLWLYTNNPLIALVIVIVLDFLGLLLTIDKTWKAPETETLSAWIFATIAAFLSILALSSWAIGEFIYPLYVFLGDIGLVGIILWRRRITTVKAGGKYADYQ